MKQKVFVPVLASERLPEKNKWIHWIIDGKCSSGKFDGQCISGSNPAYEYWGYSHDKDAVWLEEVEIEMPESLSNQQMRVQQSMLKNKLP